MDNANKKAVPRQATASNTNAREYTPCGCAGQQNPINRRDMVAGLIFSRSIRREASEMGLRRAAWEARNAADILCEVLDHRREACT